MQSPECLLVGLRWLVQTVVRLVKDLQVTWFGSISFSPKEHLQTGYVTCR